jgi:hypothetical protein
MTKRLSRNSAQTWLFQRIKRVGDSSYEAIERNAQDIITPWSKQTSVVTNVSDGSLGEDPGDLLYAVGMWLQTVDGVGAVGGSGYLPDIGIWASWVTGFADGELDISGVPRRNSYLQAIRHISAQATGSATLSKVLASGAHDEVVYIDILKELNYPAEILWRGGEAGVGYFTSDIFGGAFSGDGYGTSRAVIKRKDTKYNVDGTPRITAKLGWKDLLLLEGTTEGRMNGKVYENVETIYGKFQNYMGRTFITRETYSPIPGTPGYVTNLGTWLTERNIRNTYYEDLRLAHGVLPFSGPNPTTKYTTLENLRPFNTVSYTLTSRYVIDYDHKGRFYAAIRCEVTCSGARWDENTAVYEGFMAQTSAPSYAVKIWFESDWNGVFAQQLLVEESVTRPGFEIITISKFSPWYWPFPAYIDRDCKARVPPAKSCSASKPQAVVASRLAHSPRRSARSSRRSRRSATAAPPPTTTRTRPAPPARPTRTAPPPTQPRRTSRERRKPSGGAGCGRLTRSTPCRERTCSAVGADSSGRRLGRPPRRAPTRPPVLGLRLRPRTRHLKPPGRPRRTAARRCLLPSRL